MLEELFSESGLLNKDVTFHRGLNIIVGDYSKDRQESGINGIGKSSLIRLIDYTLLSEGADKIFSGDNYDFLREGNHTITLQLKIKDESHCIRRSFGKHKNVVLFGKTGTDLISYEINEIKQILLGAMFPIYDDKIRYEGERFRTLMNFFIKDDMEFQHRKEPMDTLGYRSSKQEMIAYNFFLMGLPNSAQFAFLKRVREYKELAAQVKIWAGRIEEETGKKIEEFENERAIAQKRIHLLENALREYKFLEVYKDIETRLTEITKEINEKLSSFYTLNRRLKRIRALSVSDTKSEQVDVSELYDELVATFSGLVKKTLEEIIEFRKNLIENRRRYNLEREKQIIDSISAVEQEIAVLEKTRANLLKQLDEKGELDALVNTYQDLLSEKTSLDRCVQMWEEIEKSNDKMQKLDLSISLDRAEIFQDVRAAQDAINQLSNLFREILDHAIFLSGGQDGSAYFNINLSPNRVRDQLPFKVNIEIPKEKAQGRFMLKLVAYDLMVFLNAIRTERRLPEFLFHDGSYHGTSKRSMTDTLNYVYQQSLRHPRFQYFVTFNQDEISTPKDREAMDGAFDFDFNKSIVARYTDRPQEMIFKRVFG